MIRRLTAADLAPYRALRLRGLRDHPDAFFATPAEERAMDGAAMKRRLRESVVLGAFVGPALAGTVATTREKNPKARHRAFLWGMYVLPGHRRLGLGAALVKEALRRLRASGVMQVRLDVGTWNRGARALYASLGFEGFGVEKRAMRLGNRWIHEEMMVCVL